MNRVTINEPFAPWNDKEYAVQYMLGIEYTDYTFMSEIYTNYFIADGEHQNKQSLEELAKLCILENNKDLYLSDFCPSFVKIISLYENEFRELT